MAQKALETRGYLVVASDTPFTAGSTVTFETDTLSWGRFSSQLRIVAETNVEDFHAQDELLGLPHTNNEYYYRTIAE